MTVSRKLARPLLSSLFVVGPVMALRDTEMAAKRAERVTTRAVPLAQRAGVPVPDDPALLVRINAAVQLAAAAALATGRMPRVAAGVLAASLVPTTLAGHPFWDETDPAQRKAQLIHFAKNLSIAGGLLIAAGDTDGRPGLAWRARHAAKDAKREARLLAAKSPLG